MVHTAGHAHRAASRRPDIRDSYVVHLTHLSIAAVVLRPSYEAIDILRRTLIEVERDLDPVADAAALSELKRVVLNRIAELEMARAREAGTPATAVPAAAIASSPKPAKPALGPTAGAPAEKA